MYVLKGKKPLYQRTHIVRKIDNNHVDLECATGICINMKGDCLSKLTAHLEQEHKWKDGGYFG